jgi:hypothetical protein
MAKTLRLPLPSTTLANLPSERGISYICPTPFSKSAGTGADCLSEIVNLFTYDKDESYFDRFRCSSRPEVEA